MLTWDCPKLAKSRDGPLSRVGNDGTDAPPRTPSDAATSLFI